MAGYRFWLQSSLSVVIALVVASIGQSQTAESLPVNPFGTSRVTQTNTAAIAEVHTCKVYSLSDLGDDPKLCKWIAETVPEMIQPASWKQTGVKISFYAPSKIMVINNTPAVHAQVDEFLQSMRKSLPQAKMMASSGITQAQFVPDGVRPLQTGGYPVPGVAQAPKHLFHFIIRYEGAGIVDSNVVKMVKVLKEEKTPTVNEAPTPVLPPPPVVGVGSPYTFPPAPLTLPMIQSVPAKSNAPHMPPADALPTSTPMILIR